MRREEWARIRRREMLAAYYQVLKDEGLQGASIAKIAKLIDAPPNLLIHYFGTKEQMTIELVDYLLEEYRHGYGDKLAAIADPRERLTAILDTFFDPEYHQLLDDSVFYACFYVSLRHPEVRKSFAALYEASLELVESTLAECMATGLVVADDAHELAVTVKALEEGYAFLIGSRSGADEAAKAETAACSRSARCSCSASPSLPDPRAQNVRLRRLLKTPEWGRAPMYPGTLPPTNLIALSRAAVVAGTRPRAAPNGQVWYGRRRTRGTETGVLRTWPIRRGGGTGDRRPRKASLWRWDVRGKTGAFVLDGGDATARAGGRRVRRFQHHERQRAGGRRRRRVRHPRRGQHDDRAGVGSAAGRTDEGR